MTFSITARRKSWIRDWDADSSAQAKVAAISFKGINLFGEGLKMYLTEDKDKKKVLPSKKKNTRFKWDFLN